MPRKIGDLTLYSVDDLHEKLGISKMTLRAYLREGKLKGRKMGVKWFVTEEAIRSYFEEGGSSSTISPTPRSYRYVVQGVNDLVSESEECETVEETLSCIESQAIISLFQVAIVDSGSGEVIELVKARDFLERYKD
ncbi:MAG: helix-turn-helix domain-containing protein [Balneolaceae bacterium]